MFSTVVAIAQAVLFWFGVAALVALLLLAGMYGLYRLIEPHLFEMEADLEIARAEKEKARRQRAERV